MAEAVKPNLTGKYKHAKVEGLDEYLKADGAGFMLRKMANVMNPDAEIQQDGDKFHFKMTFPMFTKEISFTVGEEFEETQHKGGNVMKMLPSWDGDKLIMQLTPKVEGKGKPGTHTRYLDGDELVLEMQIGDAKATRRFKRQPET